MKHVLILYFLALPFQLVRMKWWLLPITSIMSFVFFGVDMIASEIQDPFGIEQVF